MNQTYFGDGCLAEATLNVSIDSVLKFATTNTNFEFKNIHADENLIPENYEIYSFEPVPTTGKFQILAKCLEITIIQ